eukprot:3959178-Amphidinium_carterae.1
MALQLKLLPVRYGQIVWEPVPSPLPICHCCCTNFENVHGFVRSARKLAGFCIPKILKQDSTRLFGDFCGAGQRA